MSLGVIGGTLLASALKAIFDTTGIITQNQYNSPRAMRNRLAKAGLPLAYMYRGNVATQSQSPQLSLDPTLGTLPAAQARKSHADAIGQNIQNQKDKGELDWLQELSSVTPGGKVQSNQKWELGARRLKALSDAFEKKYSKEIKHLELQVEREAFAKGIPQAQKKAALDKAWQQIQNLLAQEDLMVQLKKIRGFEELANKALTENVENLPQWLQGFARILMMAFNKKM